ncbi:hypothetical protein MNBD_NITROSPINAE01-568 [hydrothermal vent metagenome]|uniref:HDOD domain-containing protein n=1 Tax=hydrothermal vent metagenome TaxID=652676 RepID=A0A3B1BTT7_9ZZZZ
MKIISLANNPKTTPTDLVNTISMDPLLTAKLLRLVNSAFYGPNRAISSLNRAVIMLGFNTVKNMALSIAVVSSIGIKDDFKWFTNEEFWQHNLGCAIAARMMGTTMGASPLEVEEFFIAGLLHDMGRAVLIQKFQEKCETIYDPDYKPDTTRIDLENEHFGISHSELGGVVARHWKFPESLIMAIGNHHAPLSMEEDHHKMLTLTVHMADQFSHKLKIGIQNSSNTGTISEEAWAAFKLDSGQAEKCLMGLPESVEDAKAFLQKIDD